MKFIIRNTGFCLFAALLVLRIGAAAVAAAPAIVGGKAHAVPPAGETVTGVYMGVPSNFTFVTPNTQSGLVQQIGKDFFVLFADGKLRRNLPSGGLDGFDAAKDRAEHPALWADYRVTGSRINIKWNAAKGDFYAERAKGGFTYQGDSYLRLPDSVPAIEGTYRRADGMEGKTRRITFGRDGRFHETGIIGPYIALNLFALPGAGTYTLKNHTLCLRYDDGRTRRIVYLTHPSDAKSNRPGVIYLNTYDLSREAVSDAYNKSAAEQVLAKGDPPLTQSMADQVLAYYEWLVETTFTPAQRTDIQQHLVAYWTTHNTEEINNTINSLKEKREVDRQPGYVQDSMRRSTQAASLPAWRQAKNDPLSLYLAAIYDANHKQ